MTRKQSVCVGFTGTIYLTKKNITEVRNLIEQWNRTGANELIGMDIAVPDTINIQYDLALGTVIGIKDRLKILLQLFKYAEDINVGKKSLEEVAEYMLEGHRLLKGILRLSEK